MENEDKDQPYYKVINETEYDQLRLTVSEFRGIEYLSLREYYLDFNGDWCPTKKGLTTALDLDTVVNLFQGLAEIMSLAESRVAIEELFGDVIRNVYIEG